MVLVDQVAVLLVVVAVVVERRVLQVAPVAMVGLVQAGRLAMVEVVVRRLEELDRLALVVTERTSMPVMVVVPEVQVMMVRAIPVAVERSVVRAVTMVVAVVAVVVNILVALVWVLEGMASRV